MTAEPSPTVTVIVVARNEERKIEACIASLAAQDYPDFKTILVDDGSSDATVAIARQVMPDIRIISSPTRSIARNRDIGWRASDSEFVAYLDADCIAPRDWLTSLMQAVQNSGAAAAGGGNCPPDEESPHFSALGLMLDTYVGSRGSVSGRAPRKGGFVQHLAGFNVMFRREALELADGYDLCFARMGEDEDLSRRLGDLGLRLWVSPHATVVHRPRADLASWARNMRGYGRGRTWLIRRHPNAMSPLFLLPPLTIMFLPFYLAMMAIYAGWVALKGGRPLLWPRLFALYAATHLAYGLGQIEGLFIAGDNPDAKVRRVRIALLALKKAGDEDDEVIRSCDLARLTDDRARIGVPIDLYLGTISPGGFDIRPVPQNPRAQDMLIADMLDSELAPRPTALSALMAFPAMLTVALGFRALVIIGGQWLCDMRLRSHAAISAFLGLARMFGARTGAFFVGIGPMRSCLSRSLLRLGFSRRSLMITRDDASTELLHQCGLAQARTAVDPAIELKAGLRVLSAE